MLHATTRVTGAALWANLHLLFWLSLVPFVTGWMGENHFAALPTAAYGVVLLMAAIAYTILQTTLTRQRDHNAALARPSSATARASCRWCSTSRRSRWPSSRRGSLALYVAVALIWLVPDRRIERVLGRAPRGERVGGAELTHAADGRAAADAGRLLEAPGHLQQREIAAVAADDLQADRQALRREAGRHRDRRPERRRDPVGRLHPGDVVVHRHAVDRLRPVERRRRTAAPGSPRSR